jgi:uncharacterized protein YprB with RNaseH-like and TPR domain
MKLKSRLSQLQTQAGAAPAPQSCVSSLRERIAELEKRGRSRHASAHTPVCQPRMAADALARKLDGELIGEGLIRIRQRLPLDATLGSIALRLLPRQPRLPGEPPGDTRRRVYIDTETTGLSGGSGTLAFLVGVAVVEAEAIILTQFLITRFDAEAAMLSAFAATLSRHDRLVSYNGKSYDLPLLISRFRMQALAHPFGDLPHLDLLHPVRRLFGRRWNDCRLQSLERRLLGLRRVDDLPGSEAPGAWFGYLRFGHATKLIKVVEHNRQDIVSLAVAHAVLSQAIIEPRVFDLDLHALARWLADHDPDQALALLQAHRRDLCDDAKRLLACLLRRAGRWPQAVALWEALAADGCNDSMERLAKYHEHVSKDLTAARRCCERMPDAAGHQHRRKRIEAKLRRQQETVSGSGKPV